MCWRQHSECQARKAAARKRRIFGAFDGIHDVLRAFFGHALQTHELLFGNQEHIGEIFNQTVRDELFNQLFADAVNVHRAARHEMFEGAFESRRTAIIRAAINRFAFGPHYRRAATRAFGWENKFFFVAVRRSVKTLTTSGMISPALRIMT